MSSEKKNPNEESGDIIAALNEAEARSVREIEEAKAGKAERIKRAHEKALAVGERARKEAEGLKAKLLEKARAEMATEEDAVFEEAMKEAAAIGRKRPDPKTIGAAAKLVLGELDV